METPYATEQQVRDLLIEAVKKAKIETLNLCLKIHHDAYTRGSFRVAVFNQIAQLEGKPTA